MGHARLVPLLLLASSMTGCLWDHASAPQPPSGAEAERAFRAFMHGAVELRAFHAREGRARHVDNGQHYRYWLYLQPFEATLRFRGQTHVRTLDEMLARQGQPGWTIEESTFDQQRLLLLGGGDHGAGEERPARGYVVFERYGQGWRLRGFDDRTRI